MKIPRPRRPRLSAKKVYATVEISGLAAIVVGVAMDTVTQIEAQLIMRHYDGFTPKSGRLRGRRTW